MTEVLNQREWGEGRPLIALHPLGLDSRSFSGIGAALAGVGYRTIGVDLPGFGETPNDDRRLTIERMAAPVIELATQLEQRPVVLGISMGGRVALEVGLREPERICAVIAIAPWLPWMRGRRLLRLARFMNPEAAERLPLERFWSTLKRLADSIQSAPYLRDDPVALGGARLIYDLSCPATRRSFVSAAREMALDPAFGRAGFWDRLRGLAVPAAFFWGGRDRLVSVHNNEHVSEFLPSAEQRILPCLAHALNGGHHRCLAEAVADLLSDGLIQRATERVQQTDPGPAIDVACIQPARRRGCHPMGSRSTTSSS